MEYFSEIIDNAPWYIKEPYRRCHIGYDKFLELLRKDDQGIGIEINIYDAIEKVYEVTSNRKMMNVKGGYWVVGFKGEFEKEFVDESFPLADIKKILICTDGFGRIMKEFALTTINQIFESNISLSKLLEMLRDYEDKNYGDEQFPCVKKSDDATAVMMSFE